LPRLSAWHVVPRNRTWWLLRLVVEDAVEPVIWLHQQRLLYGRGELARIAEGLNHPVCRQVINGSDTL